MPEQQQANHSSDLKVALSCKSLVSVTFSPGSAVQTRGMDKGSFNLALKLLIFDMLYEYSKRPLINMLALSARSCDGYQRFFFSVCFGVFLPHLSQIT